MLQYEYITHFYWGIYMRKITKYSIALAILFLILGFWIGKDLSSNIIFIFEQPYVFIGEQMRAMSLQGGFSNFFSIFVYILFSGIPLIILLLMVLKKKAIHVDFIFLPVITIALFLIMYLMVNQNLLVEMMPPVLAIHVIDGDVTALRIYNTGIILTFDAILLLYLFTRFFIFKKISIFKLINVILYVFITTLLIETFLMGTSMIISSDTVNPYDKTQEILNYFFNVVSSVIIVVILGNFQRLSTQLESNAIDLNMISLTKKISKLSLLSIFVIFSSFFIINTYQIIFSQKMFNIGFILDIPLLESFIVMVMLLITEYVKRTFDIHEENALTI